MSQSPDADRWPRIVDRFDRASELPEGERAAFLAAACGDDLALREEVESLIGFDHANHGRLDAHVRDALTDAAAAIAQPALEQIGPTSPKPS